MRLYLVRHAEAAPGEPDDLRSLTPEGRTAARKVGKHLAAADPLPAAVLTSPLLRARQTGEEIADAVGVESTPDDRLAPGASTGDVRAVLASQSGEAVVVVGHQPDCGRIAAEISGGPEPPFPAAGLVVLELA